MIYYILPKTNNILYICPNHTHRELTICVSRTVLTYVNQSKMLFSGIYTEEESFDELLQSSNPYEPLFTITPGIPTISKLNGKSNTLYDLIEIFYTLNILDNEFQTTLHITPTYTDAMEQIQFIKERCQCINSYYTTIEQEFNSRFTVNYDFLFFEMHKYISTDIFAYTAELLKYVKIILQKQTVGGICIIKMDSTFYKPTVDILYLCSSLYEKVYIAKPTTSNSATSERYMVCIDRRSLNESAIKTNCRIIDQCIHTNIYSILDSRLPLHFIHKLDDINIIIGQQQIDAIEQIMNACKHKSRDDKFELSRKSNIQKSISWCEKYKVPHNKIGDKPNIFLPVSEMI